MDVKASGLEISMLTFKASCALVEVNYINPDKTGQNYTEQVYDTNAEITINERTGEIVFASFGKVTKKCGVSTCRIEVDSWREYDAINIDAKDDEISFDCHDRHYKVTRLKK